jgi:ABC-2 type transport system permease protein
MVKGNTQKLSSILVFSIGILSLTLLNQVGQHFFFRIDLTEEKRYTISQPTREMLKSLEDEVVIEVYLTGSLPSGFKRLQRSIAETLDEFRVYAGNNIQYNFLDPSAAVSEKARNEFYIELANKGIQPTNLFAKEDGKRTEKLVFPGVVISYEGKEVGVNLLKGNRNGSPEEILNQSIEGLEYELASAIRTLVEYDRKKVAFIKGHGELDSLDLASATEEMRQFYDVYNVRLPEKAEIGNYDAIIIAKPRHAFSERDKWKIDQYLMKGGKMLLFADALTVSTDSAGGEGTFAFPMNLNLGDQLFKYGVRINQDFIQDLVSGAHPVYVGQMGDQPQIRLLPWLFYPMVSSLGSHPITRNLDAVYFRFVSSIDTVKAIGVKKTPLLHTSQYARVLAAPGLVAFNEMRNEPDPSKFQSGPLPVAYLLEGSFKSLYQNRPLPSWADKNAFLAESKDTKILVVSDGDIIKNDYNPQNGQPQALGFEPYMKQQFANKDFLMNALAYMLEEEGLILARNKEVKIRPLNKIKVEEEKRFWQVVNLVLPILILLAFAIARHFWRIRKYAKN